MSDRFDLSHLVADVTWLDEVDSTNAYLGAVPPSSGGRAVLSWNQTGGRGRLGREWVSPENKSLALSVELWEDLVPRTLDAQWLGTLSLLAGASLAKSIQPHVSGDVRVKWPNDVLIDSQKVAGILGEMPQPGRVILGVGINVWLDADELPTDLATSLALHGLRNASEVQQIVVSFLGTLHVALTEARGGLTSELVAFVKDHLGTLGHRVRVDYPDQSTRTGEAVDIDDSGRLLVHFVDTDTTEPVDAADVWHLRPVTG